LEPPVTDVLPFAGIALQRNQPADQTPDNAMMAAVVGGHYVHGHASGMSLELFGKGEILGTPAGKGRYRSDEHENYRRLFAAYNGVIVNGESASEGGWVNLGIDTVRPLAMEPIAGDEPISPNHSFTLTAYTDRQHSGTGADQQRLVAIVRTSPETGYYVDVFRSRSSGKNQFHDYLYHNIGDQLDLSSCGRPLELSPDPGLFQPVDGAQWAQNKQYLFPGWHFFTDVQSSIAHQESVVAEFRAPEMKPQPLGMRLFIQGSSNREYAKALAPSTKEAPSGYDSRPTPVLIIRQNGPAWDKPFAVLYEPTCGESVDASIRSVSTLEDSAGDFAGFTVISEIDGKVLTQYVLIREDANGEFRDDDLGIMFRGLYGVITVDSDGKCKELYIGKGSLLKFRHEVVRADSTSAGAVYRNP
jgi:hypothetical protein